MPPAPEGTVAFLFTDIVGSSKLWEKFPKAMGAALARHDAIVRSACEQNNGFVFKTVGDAFCVAFPTTRDAVFAAIQAQRELAREAWTETGPLQARMGLHTGTAEFREGDYFGGTLNRAARIEAAAHGGQILLSQISVELLQDEDLREIGFKALGEHRLRNLERPEFLFQVTAEDLAGEFPPPRSMEVLPNNLPVQTTSFIGREKEMAELRNLLEKTRLLTLMGTGGTGKTRMALETGAQLIHEFKDGVWLVELAPVADPARVAEAVATAVGARLEADRPLGEILTNFFRNKHLLLILDNCEHVLAAASGLVADLLRSCPQLKVLATSRHSLGIAGETTYAIPPLGIFDIRLKTLDGPDIADRLSQYEAVKLFIERASAVRPGFAVTNANAPAVAEICSRLDGIPLAIELAAARVRVLDVEQIAARLGDRFHLLRGGNRTALPHQQTLQALIDWSYELLTEPERAVFRRMGAFVGGRTLEALEAVCSGNGVEEFEILDLLEQLVDKSLVMVERDTAGNPRYTVIESVWQYAQQKLEGSDEADALHEKHMLYFLKWAEDNAPRLEGPDQKAWLDRFFSEHFNFRRAIEWTLQKERTEEAMRLVTALYRALEVRGNVAEAMDVVRKIFAQPAAKDVTPSVRAAALLAAGRLAWAMDQYAEVRRYHEEAKSVYQAIGDEAGTGLATMLLAFLDRDEGRLDSAEARFREALEIGQKTGTLYISAGCRSGLGSIALDHGDLTEARRLKEESLKDYEKMGDHWVTGLILWGIAKVCLAQEDITRARSALEQWSRTTTDLGNKWIVPYILACYGELALLDGKPIHAARIFGSVEALLNHLGGRFSPKEQAEHEALLNRLKVLLTADEFEEHWNAGRQLSLRQALEAAA